MVSKVSRPGRDRRPDVIAAEAASLRERIVAASRRYFLVQGFRRVTMAELADELGISKKTLYTYFRGKTELLEAMLLGKFHEIETELGSISRECESDFVAGL